jgi:hypothetical protein
LIFWRPSREIFVCFWFFADIIQICRTFPILFLKSCWIYDLNVIEIF